MNNIYLPVQNVVISTLQTSNASMNVPGTASFRKVPHPCKHALFQPLLRNNPMLKMRFFLNKSSPYWIIIMIPPFPHSVHCNHFRVQAIGNRILLPFSYTIFIPENHARHACINWLLSALTASNYCSPTGLFIPQTSMYFSRA